MLILTLENIFGSGHIDRPTKFVALSFVVDFFNWYTMFFAPVINKAKIIIWPLGKKNMLT